MFLFQNSVSTASYGDDKANLSFHDDSKRSAANLQSYLNKSLNGASSGEVKWMKENESMSQLHFDEHEFPLTD